MIHKLARKHSTTTSTEARIISLNQKPQLSYPKRLSISIQSGIQMLSYEEIKYCEADGNYTKIHLISDQIILASVCLKHINDRLPPGDFARVHQSYIIPLAAIKLIEKAHVNFHDGSRIPVSRGYKKELLRRVQL